MEIPICYLRTATIPGLFTGVIFETFSVTVLLQVLESHLNMKNWLPGVSIEMKKML